MILWNRRHFAFIVSPDKHNHPLSLTDDLHQIISIFPEIFNQLFNFQTHHCCWVTLIKTIILQQVCYSLTLGPVVLLLSVWWRDVSLCRSHQSTSDVCLCFGRPPWKQQPGHCQLKPKAQIGARVHPATPLQWVTVFTSYLHSHPSIIASSSGGALVRN